MPNIPVSLRKSMPRAFSPYLEEEWLYAIPTSSDGSLVLNEVFYTFDGIRGAVKEELSEAYSD
jgi:hypothetical protein